MGGLNIYTEKNLRRFNLKLILCFKIILIFQFVLSYEVATQHEPMG